MEYPFVHARPGIAQYTGMGQVLKIAPVGWFNIYRASYNVSILCRNSKLSV